MGNSPFVKSAVAVGCALACTGAIAANDGQGIPVGPFNMSASLGLILENDDNVYLSNANRRAATIEVLSPSVKLVTQRRDDVYSLSYGASLTRYNSGASNNNSNTQNLTGEADIIATSRLSFKLKPSYVLGIDPIGTTYGGAVATPNKWRNAGISGTMDYGSAGAKGKIELAAGYMATKYLNNRNITIAFDKKITNLGGTFFYRVMPRTSLLFEASNARYAYDNAASLVPNNSIRNYLIGAQWESTAKTTGDFRIGQVQQRYEGGAIPDFTGTGWNGSITWNAKPYSRVNLALTRQPQQSTLPGSSLYLVTSSTADWAYDWDSRFTAHLNASRINEDFRWLGVYTTNNSYGVSVDYRMRRWFTANLGWKTWSKSVNLPAYSSFFVYDRNVFMLSLVGSL